MPSPKDGSAGTLVAPTPPDEATDALDGQAGQVETAPSGGHGYSTDTGPTGSSAASARTEDSNAQEP